MLSRQEYLENKASDHIIYCFADGTTKEITMEEYLHYHPEHSAEDFRIIKELSDELLHKHYLSDRRSEDHSAGEDFECVTKHIAASGNDPLEYLLQQEQRRFAFRIAARLLHSGQLSAMQRRCFIAYFIEGKSVSEIARNEKTYRMKIWRHIRHLENALRNAV